MCASSTQRTEPTDPTLNKVRVNVKSRRTLTVLVKMQKNVYFKQYFINSKKGYFLHAMANIFSYYSALSTRVATRE